MLNLMSCSEVERTTPHSTITEISPNAQTFISDRCSPEQATCRAFTFNVLLRTASQLRLCVFVNASVCCSRRSVFVSYSEKPADTGSLPTVWRVTCLSAFVADGERVAHTTSRFPRCVSRATTSLGKTSCISFGRQGKEKLGECTFAVCDSDIDLRTA